ncbi:sigma-70 family RNA polymerase sigma factor [Dokdonia sinensis]|uniref:Sigma-70 family RNA polymerase sigma factor n=1 Tax=Dokdonia sinensis TaxID=2479847 RepID=A0A3M0GN06_9FLAO|nr:sigma-70 family RNA polymerase sigma factor [Dokdonia sinensis]RMB64112.1 sigma-70 family RNA polymerase sigma factor [Dokdonia sinensis]
MSDRKHILRTKNYRVQVTQYYKRLERYKSSGNKSAFYNVFVSIIPELRKYIKTRLQELLHQGHFPHNFYEEDDFVDDLFISVYEHFDTLESEEDFYMFLFSEMDRLLKKVERKEQDLHQPLEDIESYAKAERYRLREKMTAQLDGDIILKQELDDVSYASQQVDFKTVFEERSEKSVDAKIDKELTHSLTSKQVDELIKNLPQVARNIATLYIHFHLTIPEIIKVTQVSREEVRTIIDQIKKLIRTELFNV